MIAVNRRKTLISIKKVKYLYIHKTFCFLESLICAVEFFEMFNEIRGKYPE